MTEPLGEDALVGTIEVRTVGDEFYAGWTSGDGTVGCAGDHANTPVGALAHLCSVLIKLDEDEAAPELLAALEAVLLFHSGRKWDATTRREWSRLVGVPDATTKVVCDVARSAIAKARGETDPTSEDEG